MNWKKVAIVLVLSLFVASCMIASVDAKGKSGSSKSSSKSSSIASKSTAAAAVSGAALAAGTSAASSKKTVKTHIEVDDMLENETEEKEDAPVSQPGFQVAAGLLGIAGAALILRRL
jgi:hypothetical protein